MIRFVLLLASSIAGALALPSLSLADQERPALIPIHGHPYVSTRTNGSRFVGTIRLDIRGFALDQGDLIVTGRLIDPRRSKTTEFPVVITKASCEVLELEIGPPPIGGLLDPLRLVETAGASELRLSDFCAIAAARGHDDMRTVVDELNELEELDAGLLGQNSCPWYEKAACGTGIAACAATCIDPVDAVCELCFAGLGVANCYSCL